MIYQLTAKLCCLIFLLFETLSFRLNTQDPGSSVGLVPFMPTSFKPLKAEGEEMLLVMVEGAQLLCFSHFPSMLRPSTRQGPWNS